MTINHASANGKFPSTNGNSKIAATLAATSQFQFLKPIKFQKTTFGWSYGALFQSKVLFSDEHGQKVIGSFLKRSKTVVRIKDDEIYRRVTIRLYGNGVKVRDEVKGKQIGTKSQFLVKKGQFILSRIDARNGAFAIATDEIDGAIVTNDFPVYDINEKIVNSDYFALLISTNHFSSYFQELSSGTTNRQRINESDFLNLQIPVPSIKTQEKLIGDYQNKISQAEKFKTKAENLEKEIEKYLFQKLGLEVRREEKQNWRNFSFLQSASLAELNQWGYDKILNLTTLISQKYELKTFEENPNLFIDVFRGKSPKYDKKSKDKILNQKCIRWNEIILDYAKEVQSNWKNSIDSKFFTRENDVLVNSTGEGTIGRCAVVNKAGEDFLTDSHILSLRVNEELLSPQFFATLFNSSFCQQQISDIKSAESTKQTELGINNLFRIKFPLPPLKIQNTIIKQINKMKEERAETLLKSRNLRRQAKNDFESELFEL